ncbi:hypothetical protein JB92DRAFT_2844273 [Gautieria morchelliformis]|nr:hypothetical protein JB92DRAFT_2844273 [Gautieria morchelliformis]
MGWFSWFSSQPSPPAGQAPDRSQRRVCWDARDAYFAYACLKQKKLYEEKCARSWIDYFNQRRVLQEEQKDQLAMAKAQAEEAARGKQ